MPRQWFIKTKTGQLGPVSTRKLARLARRGKLKPNMAISHDAEVWFQANKIAELTFPEAAVAAEVNAERQPDSKRRDQVQWYVLTKHGVAGPFTHRKLRKLARRGQLDPCVGVSRDRVKWNKAKRVPGLKFPAPVPAVDQPADPRPTEAAAVDGLDPPSMLCQLDLPLFTDDEPLPRSLRPRQLAWFGVQARSQAWQNKALYYTAAISHGDPPRPIFVDSALDGFAFMIPGVTADFRIHESARIADDSLQLLWVIPTTASERKFLAEQGIARFCGLLNQNRHPLAFDPGRRCYAAAATSRAM